MQLCIISLSYKQKMAAKDDSGKLSSVCHPGNVSNRAFSTVTGLNMKNLMNELAPVTSKFFEFGIQLGIHEDKLEELEGNHRVANRCFSAVLSFWKKGNTDMPVEWESICKALESPSVGQKGLAKQLRKAYGTTHIQGCCIPRYINLVIVIILTPYFFFSYSLQQIQYLPEFLVCLLPTRDMRVN